MIEIKDLSITDQKKSEGKKSKTKKSNEKDGKEKFYYSAVKEFKQKLKEQKKQTKLYSKRILKREIISTTNSKPDINKYVIELVNVKKSYITGEVEIPVLKGIDLKLEKGDFIVILGPSGSGKTTLLNIISGLDKVSSGDVFVIGYNLSLLKDIDLTKFRRDNIGFIFQQYNLLTNLTAKENAEVGENLSKNKNKDMTIKDIFETIGMEEQMNKYPHQMSGGQQQRVSIARALAKNPNILFGDEPTGALDEEMGRKVLEILVDVNKKYKTTVIIVTHNPNIADIANIVIHVRNGLIDQIKNNTHPKKPSEIDWS
ncbi:ABC transporter ATP-binding protein [Spiroplasma endosymbiont of Polydrusus formosus]|uniref:ABC transporter ATP-binding protein n=1 Tax=Spiroplasma endosymbiont of Polydrusus formosus TaxID=3139326 RepID=UPI0035B52BAC